MRLGVSLYSTGPREHYKSAHWAIQTLVQIVAKGGNLLLGIGPNKQGVLVPEVISRLQEIGDWMRINGKAIYNSKPYAPYQKDNWCFTQSDDGKVVYAFFLLNNNDTVPELFTFPDGFAFQYKEINVLGSNLPLQQKKTGEHLTFSIPQAALITLEKTPVLVFELLQ